MKNKLLFAALALIFLASCVSFKSSGSNSREIIVRSARNMLDKEYVYGMQDEHAGFDCSGLVQFVYFEAGVRIPRTVKKQYDSSRRISLDQLQPADLVFFSTFAAGPTHVGIFIGGGKFIHAPSEGKKVEIKELDNVYWNKVYYGAGSFF